MAFNYGYSLHFKQIGMSPSALSHNLTLLLIVKGEVTVETNSNHYYLKEKDLLVLNQNEWYEMKGKKDNAVLTLEVEGEYLNNYYPAYRDHRFDCFSKETDMGRMHLVRGIRQLLAEMKLADFRKEDSYRVEMESHVSRILLFLIRGFREESHLSETHLTSDTRISEIITYLQNNYDRSLSLEEVADRFYLSSGYLSRYFKQETKTGFHQYVKEIRVAHAKKDLLYTNDTVGQIAYNTGFPNVKSLTEAFKEVHSLTPTAYRKEYGKKETETFSTAPEIRTDEVEPSKDLLTRLQMMASEYQTEPHDYSVRGAFEHLSIDVSKGGGRQKYAPKNNIYVGELSSILREDVQSQLRMIKKEIGMEYAGVRYLISGDTILPKVETDEKVATTSRYYNADSALNFLKANSMSLFIQIDYREITEDEQAFFEEWSTFLKHCHNLYGKHYMESWRVMFREPSPTYVSEEKVQSIYLKLHRYTKDVIPGMKVGSFLPYSFQEEEVAATHRWLMKKEIPCDFFGYEANQNENIDLDKLEDEHFTYAGSYITDKTEKVKAYLKKKGKTVPLHLTNWNTLTGDTRYTNGTFFRGALVFKTAMELSTQVESISFWVNTDQHENKKMDRTYTTEGMELFHYFNGRRPAYHALHFLQRLEGSVISESKRHVMTSHEQGYQLILFNDTPIHPYYTAEQTLMERMNKDVYVTLSGLEPGDYQIRKWVFDNENGALYHQWQTLNSQHGIDDEVIRYIVDTSRPSLEIFDKTFKEEWSFYSYLLFNALHFYELRKILM